MRIRFVLAVVAVLLAQAFAQDSSDALVRQLLSQIVARSGALPQDAIATGTITVFAGGKTDSGTIRVATRGTEQSLVETSVAGQSEILVYSKGRAARRTVNGLKRQPLEVSLAAQSPEAVFALLSSALQNPRISFEYVGRENLDNRSVEHLRYRSKFSELKSKHLQALSAHELWVDSTTLLPVKLGMEQRDGFGRRPAARIEVFFSDYRNIDGVLFPFVIQKRLNGSSWATISFNEVRFNSGLPETEFSID